MAEEETEKEVVLEDVEEAKAVSTREVADLSSWKPKTLLGKKVKSGEIKKPTEDIIFNQASYWWVGLVIKC